MVILSQKPNQHYDFYCSLNNTIKSPASGSGDAFTYTSSNTLVATITGNLIYVVGV
jgi:hypothetical protein